MELAVFVGIISLLKNGDKVCPALVQVSVILRVHGVDLKPDNLKVAPRDFAGFPDVGNIRHFGAFAGEDQDLLQTGSGNGLHLLFNFCLIKPCAVDFVVAVEPAVDAVIFAVVGNVKRGEKIDGVAELPPGLPLGGFGHLFQKRLGSQGEKRGKIFRSAVRMGKRTPHICRGIPAVIIVFHGREDLFHHIGFEYLHAGEIGHLVNKLCVLHK